MSISLSTSYKIGGRYKIVVRREDGSIKEETDWFDNLITNQGLDWFGSIISTKGSGSDAVSVAGRCAVGTGNTAPANTDTTLTAQLSVTPTWSSLALGNLSSASYVPGPPAYLTSNILFTFATGAVVGNIAEVGVGVYPSSSVSTDPLQLFSHALIMSGGSPTTISVTSADQLQVTFELRWYINTTDTPYNVTIASVNYSGVIRACVQSSVAGLTLGTQIDKTQGSGTLLTNMTVYNGSIGIVTAAPSGTSASLGSAPVPAYTTGSYNKSYTFSADVSHGNVSGGITALSIGINPTGWQLSVSPALPKDNTKTMTLTVNVSWARYP